MPLNFRLARDFVMIRMVFWCVFCWLSSTVLHAKSGFEVFGDVMQMLPFATMTYAWGTDDTQGVKEQAIGSGATLLATYAIKYSFVGISRSNENLAYISQRPNNGSFDGFPSGHTSFSFSSVGFAYKRYGYKAALPLGALATLTGISRVYAQRHTTSQVIAGAILGFALSYICATPLQSQDSIVSFSITPQNTYLVSFIKIF